jgi:hypothetical protein
MSGFNIFSNTLNDLFNNVSSSNDECETPKNDIEVYMNQNRSLWRAVILQTIIDILNNSSRTENKIAKIEAKQWVFYDNDDFKQVCNLAGYNIKYVRKKIMEIMRQNLISKIVINKIHREEKFSSFVNDNCFDNNFYEKKIQYFNYM